MKIVIITPYYLPGFKAGGPVRSVANLVEQLGGEFEFRVLTRDRDLGDRRPYESVQPNVWQAVGRTSVLYLRPSMATPIHIVRAVRDVQPELLYFNSFFNAPWCVAPLALLRRNALATIPVVIAPRGQFGAGALRFHAAKKRAYFAAFRALGLADRITWQATCESEREDIHRIVGRTATVVVATNLSDVQSSAALRKPKQPDELRLVFYSRVSPKKNLLGAIELLHTLPGNVSLDICGPVEDRAYERRCRQQIATLPENINVQWLGPVAPTEVADTLARYDAMLLPTFGENFGHAIVESLAAGCPAVISDRTPWRNLAARGVGWDVPLDSPHGFQQALAMLSSLDESSHEQMRVRATQFAAESVRSPEQLEAHRRMFQLAFNGCGGSSRAA